MSERELEQILKDLPRMGRLIGRTDDRQLWRFEFQGKPVDLHFYPVSGVRARIDRRLRGSPALRQFTALQWLHKARISSPRAIATLLGFTIEGVKGDAVLVQALEPATSLDRYLVETDAPDPALFSQMLDLLEKLGRAGMGHSNLHPSSFLVHKGTLYLNDVHGVHRQNLRLDDLARLAHAIRPYVSRTDLYRAWIRLGPGGRMPTAGRALRTAWSATFHTLRSDGVAGHLSSRRWRGEFFRSALMSFPWSAASRIQVSAADWQRAFPQLLAQLESDQLETIKESRAGNVYAGEIILGGKPLPIIVKRPRRKFWYRYINEIGRGSRAWRAWIKAWKVISRNIPTAWPLLVMEKRSLAYVTDALIVFERIPGGALSSPKWRAQGPGRYHDLLFRVGRLLRQLEENGLYLYDAKADNWMVRDDTKLGLVPLLIDVDGLRPWKIRIGGFNRLLRSLRENASLNFTPDDAMALARGYAPFAHHRELLRLIGNGLADRSKPALASDQGAR